MVGHAAGPLDRRRHRPDDRAEHVYTAVGFRDLGQIVEYTPPYRTAAHD
jgi:hypothetical protein